MSQSTLAFNSAPLAGRAIRCIVALAALVALLPLLIVPLTWEEQAIAGAGLILLAIVLNVLSRSAPVTMLLMVFSVFSTLRYGFWRTAQTWEGITSAGHIHRWDTIFVLLLLAAEYFAFFTLILGYFQTLRPLHRQPLALTGSPSAWPSVDLLIPTYNEPLHVVRGTVAAAMAIDYPRGKMRVLLLDDGRRDEFRAFAARTGVEYVTRDDNAHAKAGNINHALNLVRGEFVAIFDCDHVPARSFLQTTIGWFLRDPHLGLLQTPHHFYSPDPFERNLGLFRKVPNEGELFHRLVQDGNDLWNASFFCGSCAVLRRAALDEIEGIAVETVTEDAHTALRMQRRGWNTAFINIPKAAGLATESLAAHIGQRIRWARGMTQILRIENPLFASGLTLPQRLCYFNATTHFLFAVPRLIFLTVPLAFLLFGKVNIYGYTWAIIAYAIPHLVLSNLTNSRIQGRHRFSFWNEIYEAVLAPYILFPTLLALINPRLGKFNVTSKGGILRRSYFDLRIALPYLLLLGLNLAGLVMAEHRFVTDPTHRDTVIMNGAWACYNAMILSVAASVAWERHKLRSGAHLRVRIPAILETESDRSPQFSRRIDATTVSLARNCVTVKARAMLARGTSLTLLLGDQGSDCEFPALVAHSTGRHQHLYLPDLTEEQEDRLESLMYRHRRAWRALRNSQPIDRPWRSLLHIFVLALRGLAIVPVGIFMPPPPIEHEEQRRRRPSIAAALVFIFLLLTGSIFSPRVAAAVPAYKDKPETIPGKTAAAQPANFHDEMSLGAAAGTRTLSFNGNRTTLNFFFGEPVTKVATNATLRLLYSAPELHPGEAHLQLTLNKAKAGTIALVPGAAQQADISLPTELLTNDNALSFQLVGSCANCNPDGAPWVTIDPDSGILIDGTRLPLRNDLSLLPLPFFDAAGLRSWSMPIVLGDHPDDITLQGAALIASWFGVLSDVRGVNFPVSVGEIPKGNAVIVAVRSSQVLAGLSLPSKSGPLLAMRDNPHDPYGKLLIVTGDGPNDLLQAARALTAAVWMPHVDSLRVHAAPTVRRAAYDAPRWLATDTPAAIGTYTTDEHLRLQGTGSITLFFRLPPDLFLRARQSVPLQLRYRYSGAPRGSRPAIHIRLNGEDIESAWLKPASTPTEGSEIFRLPTGSLLPYTNTLTIDFYFAHEASAAQAHPSFAVHRNSTIDLEGLPHSVLLPRLELFANAGYPFTEWPDLSRTATILPDAPTPTELEILLDMAGFFGAQTGALATGIEVARPDAFDAMRNRDLVLIGTPVSQPLLSAWGADMPLDLSESGLPVHEAPESTLLLHPEWPFRGYDALRLKQLAESGADVDATVESFASPLHAGRLVVAIIPAGPSALDAVRALFAPSQRRGPVYGGVTVFHDGHFESFLVGTLAFHSGELNRVQYATVLIFENYRLIPLAVLFLAGVIVAWVRYGTERVAARRLAALES